MGINIRTNVESINAQRRLTETTDRLRKAYGRLSSGLRITTAADDAAGLSIAESLKADSRIAQVSIRNANDGISIIAITDGAMDQGTNVLTRMAELADQSANGVYSTTQRSALQLEFRALASELQRIAETTEFNGLTLLSGTTDVVFQIGFDGQSHSQVSFSSVESTLGSLGLGGVGNAYAMTYSIIDTTVLGSQAASRSALDAVRVAINSLTTNRGKLGATEARLNVAITNLMVARENFSAAESRIRDVDVAAEAAELTRLNILQQAASAVLSQANQQPSIALSLLQQ
ncbi:MAG: flagellin FliC [Deltaproteobacteria bacterium]|nr:flagellin FliC [Deltaproteobacteria bacterium]